MGAKAKLASIIHISYHWMLDNMKQFHKFENSKLGTGMEQESIKRPDLIKKISAIAHVYVYFKYEWLHCNIIKLIRKIKLYLLKSKRKYISKDEKITIDK